MSFLCFKKKNQSFQPNELFLNSQKTIVEYDMKCEKNLNNTFMSDISNNILLMSLINKIKKYKNINLVQYIQLKAEKNAILFYNKKIQNIISFRI